MRPDAPREAQVKLYNQDLSPYSARCRIQIRAKGLAVEIVDPPGGLHSDEFRRLAPLGKVPALEVEGGVIAESEVICEYLEDAFPEPALRPADPLARARVRLISRFHDLYLIPPLEVLWGQLNPKTRDTKLVDEKLSETAMRLDQLELIAPGTSYAAGNELTLADCALAPYLFFAVRMLPNLGRKHPGEGRPKIAGMWEAQQADPAVAPVLHEMDLALQQMLRDGI
jgi:glutathione S-transferase